MLFSMSLWLWITHACLYSGQSEQLNILQGKENPSNISPPQPNSICTIMYTSGTSGDPKGVVLTHENIATFVRGMDLFMEQFEDKVIFYEVIFRYNSSI